MTPIEILFTTLAGLGLFFFGIKTVTRHLAAVAGDGLRRHLHRATANPISGRVFLTAMRKGAMTRIVGPHVRTVI